VARRGDAREVVDERLRLGERLPGFGHRIYPDTDPRFTALLELVRASRPDRRRLAAVDAVVDAAAERVDARPNIDLALAALVHGHDLPPTSGECIFAIARTAGWTAHALEEYDERPLRFRPQAVYVPTTGSVRSNGEQQRPARA
jgi:citrate synthase